MDVGTLAIALAVLVPVAGIIIALVYHLTKKNMAISEQQALEQVSELEKKLKEQEKEFERLNLVYSHVKENSPYLIMLVNQAKEIISCSASAARLLGYPDGTFPEKRGLSYLLERGARKKQLDEIISTLEAGREYFNVITLDCADGDRTLQLHAHTIKAEEPIYLVFMIDVTSQIQQNEKVIEALRMRDRLILTMSHEVRTPLNAIIGSVDLLMLTDDLPEKERTHMRNIHEASHALLNMVNETIDYAEIESNEIKIENKRFDFLEMLLQIRTSLYIKTLSKGIEFFLEIEPDIPKHIIGDEKRLRQVMVHILANAIKYTDQGCVRLKITRKMVGPKEYLHYEVKDTGIGIRQENQKDIFKAFSNISEKAQEYRSGIGLGLMVCQRLVKMMGGEISFTSEWGKGTSFFFDLELVGSENDPIANVKQAQQKSILICSDDELLARHLVEMSGKLGVSACWNHEMTMVEEFYTHILIDNKMSNAREWLEREMPYSCEKILVIEDSRSASRAMKKADRIMYHPVVCNMIADVLNKSELSNFNNNPKGKKELIFKVDHMTALVVDDNSVNTLVASNILKQFGFVTEEVSSGALAMKKVYSKCYDVIFMDYQMPQMDGIESTIEVRKLENGKTPMIFALTANITEDITSQFKEAGANDILAKPIEMKELSELLHRWIPKDKILVADSEAKKEAEHGENTMKVQPDQEKLSDDPKMDALLRAMKAVPELDVEVGLSHVIGDMDGYVRILEISNSNILQAEDSILDLNKTAAYDDMRIHFHSLKGIFANIGAQELSEESRKMEFASRDHDHAYIKTYLDNYLTSVDKFMEGLEDALKKFKHGSQEPSQEAAVSISEDEREQMYTQLEYLISRFEINDVGDMFTILIQASEGDEKEMLVRANNEIENFQYDKALEILAERSK